MMDYIKRCAELEQRIAELETENRELRRQLGLRIPEPVKPAPTTTVHMHSTPAEKIRLFRSLFHGREDVFAQRWYSTRTEKAGYTRVTRAVLNPAKLEALGWQARYGLREGLAESYEACRF